MKGNNNGGRGQLPGIGTVVLVAVVASLVLVMSGTGGALVPLTDQDSNVPQEPDEFEPNDEFGTATGITAPVEVDVLETSSDDRDFFAIDLKRGDHLNVSVAFDHETGDTDLILYNPNRTAIASSLSVTDDEAISIQASETGKHYLLVVSSATDPAGDSIAVDREQGDIPQDDQFEPNDGFDSATGITTPFARDDLQILTHDRDVYALEMPDDSTLVVSAQFDHNDTDLDIRLYDKNQELVAASATISNEESITRQIDEAGTYYVEVYSDDDKTGRYTLSVQGTSLTSTGTTSTDTSTSADTPTPTMTEEDVPGFTGVLALFALTVFTIWRLKRR